MKPRSERARKDLLGSIVEQELTRAEGGESDELQHNRQQAMEYYLGALPAPPSDGQGNLLEGRSDIVSMDVANTTNAMLAMMREMLILDAELVIEPEGEEDEALAQAESDICSDVLLKENPGERMLLAAIKDGLLLKNGVLKVRQQDDRCIVEACPIENISYSAGYDGALQTIPFFAERVSYTRSELVSRGIPKATVDELNAHSDYITGTERARNATFRQQHDGETRDQDEIDCHEAYILTDMDGDGISERYRVLVADKSNCLEYEPVDAVPYAMGSPFLAPHRLTGESMFDRLWPIQDSNTRMLRAWHDNISVNNNGRYIYDPDRVTEDDIFAPMAGGGIRATDPTAIVPLMVNDMTPGIQQAMEYNRRQRTEAVGAALDMASAEAQLANKAATVASIEKGNQELVSAMVANNFALTLIKGVYQLIHYHLRNFSTRAYTARIAGQSVPVDPSVFQPGRRMHVRCGMSPSQKANQQQALNMHMQLQAQAMLNGLDGVIASENTLYRTSMRWLKANGVADPESLAVDPTSPQAQATREQKAMAAQQQAQEMMAAQQQQITMTAQLEQAKLAEDARQHDTELEFKYFDANLDAENKDTELTAKGALELEKQRMTNEQAERTAERAAAEGSADTGGNT